MATQKIKSKGSGLSKVFWALLIFLVAGGVLLYLNLGDVVKATAEKIGSDTLGVNVSIASVDIDIPNKTVDVWDIAIGNPPGFESADAMTVGHVSIAAQSFAPDLLSFDNIAVSDTDIYMDINKNGTNIGAINRNLKDRAAPKQQKKIKVIIDEFLLSSASLHTRSAFLAKDPGAVNVPDIRLTGIGEEQNGVLAGQAVAQIWQATSSKVIQTAGQSGLLQGLPDDAMEQLRQSVALPEGFSAGTVIEQGAEKVQKGLKNLLGD